MVITFYTVPVDEHCLLLGFTDATRCRQHEASRQAVLMSFATENGTNQRVEFDVTSHDRTLTVGGMRGQVKVYDCRVGGLQGISCNEANTLQNNLTFRVPRTEY